MINTPLFSVFMPNESVKLVNETLRSGYLAEGPRVRQFTELLNGFLGNKYLVPVNSGTTALKISYRLAGIGPGDEVITTPLTCVAANTPLLELGAKIVWADVDPANGMLDIESVKSKITNKTKAIVLLHKDGYVAQLDEFISLAAEREIRLIEDGAHIFGASLNGTKVGNFRGTTTCFSFQAIKHVTTGDGGLIACDTAEDFEVATRLKWLGVDKGKIPQGSNPWDSDILELGYKGNLNDISAAIGIGQMVHVENNLEIYKRNAALYKEYLCDVDCLKMTSETNGSENVYWTFVIRVEKRAALQKYLKENGVESKQVHPRNDTYSLFKEFQSSLPGVDTYSKQELSIPCGWWVSTDEVIRISNLIKDFK